MQYTSIPQTHVIKHGWDNNCRGVSDVGFPIFADTDADADFAF